MMKKLITLFVVVCMLFSSIIIVRANEEKPTLNLGLLSALNIVGEVLGNKEGFVSRGEFAKIMVGLINAPNILMDKAVFNDVSSEYPYYDYINTLYAKKIISGNANGEFNPDVNIKSYEALKIIVNSLGYGAYANAQGGYPNGYINVGTELKLSSCLSNFYGELPMADMVKLLLATLNTEIMEETVFGNDIKFHTQPNKTVLSEYHNVYKTKGVVTGNEITKLNNSNGVGKNKVCIGEQISFVGKTDVATKIGYKVTAYIQKPDSADTGTVIYYETSNASEIASLRGEDISLIENLNTYIKLKNNDNYYRISADYDIIYNGVADIDFDIKSLAGLPSAYITLIDSNEDDTADVIQIKQYTDYVVKLVTSDGRILDKYTNAELNTTKSDPSINSVFYNKDGKLMEVSDIAPMSVLTVYASNDGNNYIAYVSENVLEGKIVEISRDNNIRYAKIENTSFAVSRTGEENILITNNQFDVGYEGEFYLNIYNEISAVENAYRNDFNYAYLVDHMPQKGLNIDIYDFKMFTADNEMVIVSNTKKLLINGKKPIKDTDGKTLKLDKLQLIRYTVNDKKQLLTIDTATDSNGRVDEANFVKNGSIAGMFRAAGSNTFNFKYKIGKKTVIFGVPKDKTAYDEYTLLSAASFKDNYTYSGYAYDANYVNVPNVIVADLLDKAQNLDENIICVDRVITALNREKEGIKKIIGVQNGQNIEYNCISGIGDNVKAGDIIRVATNNQNAVELVLVICNVLSQATPGSTGASEYTMQNGYVYAATDEALVYRKSDGTIDELTQSFTPENVTLLYDSISREPKFQKATTEEVISERDNPIMKSFVFTYRRNGYVINTIIVK